MKQSYVFVITFTKLNKFYSHVSLTKCYGLLGNFPVKTNEILTTFKSYCVSSNSFLENVNQNIKKITQEYINMLARFHCKLSFSNPQDWKVCTFVTFCKITLLYGYTRDMSYMKVGFSYGWYIHILGLITYVIVRSPMYKYNK